MRNYGKELIFLKNPENQLFHEYISEWVNIYKKGVVRSVTLVKYYNSIQFIKNNFEALQIKDLNKKAYQGIINKYSENHHKQTTTDFNNNLKASIMDAVDEGLIPYNPTRGVVIKGNPQKKRVENKYLNKEECNKLISELNLNLEVINYDWLILLLIKTGLRFAEALALTPNDFNGNIINIENTFDYKFDFKIKNETKSKSSKRKIQIDDKFSSQMQKLINNLPENKPIFIPVSGRIFNSTVNFRLKHLCSKANIPIITVHGLRHTHASILFYAGVSVHSISRRLGHSKASITQDVYLHIIKELEDTDNDKIKNSLLMIG